MIFEGIVYLVATGFASIWSIAEGEARWAVAGVVIAAVGEGWCFAIDGVSYIAVITGLLLMRLPYNSQPSKTTSAWTGFREAIVDAASAPWRRLR